MGQSMGGFLFLSFSTKLRLVNLISHVGDKIWLTGWLKVTNFDFLDGLSSIHFGPWIMLQYKNNLRFGVHHRKISSTFINRCDKNWLTSVGIAEKDWYSIWWLPQSCLCWWFKSANNYGYDAINRFVRANIFIIKMMTSFSSSFLSWYPSQKENWIQVL